MRASRATKITPFRLVQVTLDRLDELCRVSGKSRTAQVEHLITEAYSRDKPQDREDASWIGDHRSVTLRKKRERNAVATAKYRPKKAGKRERA
jgi:hypothetical protein